VLASRHTAIESLDVLFTVAAYTALVALERLFDRNRFLKALAVLTLAFAAVITTVTAADFRAPFLVFGLVNGVFLRAIDVFMKSSVARTSVILTGFAAVGLTSFHATPAACASWLLVGAGYRLMAGLVARVDAALFNHLQLI